jgi:hypothetical protein
VGRQVAIEVGVIPDHRLKSKEQAMIIATNLQEAGRHRYDWK